MTKANDDDSDDDARITDSHVMPITLKLKGVLINCFAKMKNENLYTTERRHVGHTTLLDTSKKSCMGCLVAVSVFNGSHFEVSSRTLVLKILISQTGVEFGICEQTINHTLDLY